MVKKISSKENIIIKEVKRLDSKKYRDKYELFIVEGMNLIEEITKENADIEFVLYSDRLKEEKTSKDLLEKLIEKDILIYEIDEKIFSYISSTETPQGILGVIKKPKWDDDVFIDGENVLVLDRVQDPGNLGTVIRTAEAAGYRAVIAMKGTTDIFSPKVVRSGAGAIVRMPIIYMDTPKEAIDILKKNNKKVVCTTPRSDNVYFEENLKSNIALVIGNEASGACEEFIKGCDIGITIPMQGKTESLNAAVAAAIIMFESARQRYEISNG